MTETRKSRRPLVKSVAGETSRPKSTTPRRDHGRGGWLLLAHWGVVLIEIFLIIATHGMIN